LPSEPERRKARAEFSAEKAHAAQLHASESVIRRNMLPEKIDFVAGVDVAYAGKFSVGAADVLEYTTLSLVESKTSRLVTMFPYIPTLLSFREVCPLVAAIGKLALQPSVFLVDGHGVMHPYRFGLASHLGLAIGKPTIGVAKNPLVGEVHRFNEEGWAPVVDDGETVGAALLTRSSRRPLYVSVGHMVSLEKAIAIVRHCTPDTRVPQPILSAHASAEREKRKSQNRS
jgi:deoxyribonuclease V